MSTTRIWAVIVLLLSGVWYRGGDQIKNSILVRSPFPVGYIAGGNYTTDCKTLASIGSGTTEGHPRFCEDQTFWLLYDDQGEIVERPVILSCDPGRKSWNTVMGPLLDPSPHGTLWLYVPSRTRSRSHPLLSSNLAPDQAHRITFTNYPPNHDFHPLGIQIWPSYAGSSSYLYVVNHARHRTVIEQFSLNPSNPLEATHLRTLGSGHFHSANALVLTSPSSFYVSNDHLFTRRLPVVGHVLPLMETLLTLPFGFVSHVALNAPGSQIPIAHQTFAKLFIPFPNGVAISHSGNQMAIVSTSTAEVRIFTRDPATNELSKEYEVVRMPFSPDNIHFTPSRSEGGNEELIVGGHPNFRDLSAVAANKTGAAAPSWVAVLTPNDGGTANTSNLLFDQAAPVSLSSKVKLMGRRWTMETLFQSNGREDLGGFGSSATGLRDPETGGIYVSGLYAQDGVVVCTPSGNL